MHGWLSTTFLIDLLPCISHYRCMTPTSFAELLDQFGPTQLADGLGVPYETARAMRSRASVAPAHWERLIALAASHDIDLSMEALARFAVERARG